MDSKILLSLKCIYLECILPCAELTHICIGKITHSHHFGVALLMFISSVTSTFMNRLSNKSNFMLYIKLVYFIGKRFSTSKLRMEQRINILYMSNKNDNTDMFKVEVIFKILIVVDHKNYYHCSYLYTCEIISIERCKPKIKLPFITYLGKCSATQSINFGV